jgi:Lipid desaturase domain
MLHKTWVFYKLFFSRPQFVLWAQAHGIMMSPSSHNKHHQGSHDTNFCIGSGLMNPIITYMYGSVSNKWCWLFLFLFAALADVPILNYAMVQTGF